MNARVLKKARNATLASITTVLLASASPAVALDSTMQEMFDGMSTGTVDPNHSLGQRRGHITGGAARVRFDTGYAPELYRVQLPEWSMGCGGIDLFGGALSWIGADALADTLRQMAGPQVVAYAVGLAVEAMCPTCAKHMAELQDKLNQFQNMMNMSCETAGAALYEHSGMQAGAERIHEMAKGWMPSAGSADDDAEARHNYSSGDSPMTEAVSDGGEDDIFIGNVTWQAIKDSEASGWFAWFDDHEIEMIMLSIIGTIIYSPPSDGSDQPEINVISGDHIHLADFVIGPEENPGGGYYLGGLSCGGDFTDCMDPEPVSDLVEMDQTFAEMVHERIDPLDPGSIAAKFQVHQDGIALDADEEQFLADVDLPVAALFRQAAMGQSGLELYSRELSIVIATQLAKGMLLEIVDAIQVALDGQDEADRLRDRIPEIRRRFRDQADEIRQSRKDEMDTLSNLVLFTQDPLR